MVSKSENSPKGFLNPGRDLHSPTDASTWTFCPWRSSLSPCTDTSNATQPIICSAAWDTVTRRDVSLLGSAACVWLKMQETALPRRRGPKNYKAEELYDIFYANADSVGSSHKFAPAAALAPTLRSVRDPCQR